MKYLKRAASLLLALVMALALAAPAFAADEGSITVDNPQKDQDYTAYKIFDVAYNDGKSAYSYTIDSSSEWFGTVDTYAKTENSGLTLEKVGETTIYNVSVDKAKFSAPAFAEALKAAVEGKDGTKLTADGTVVSAKNLPLGYYFVTSSTGALCNLTTTNPNVTIHDKNDVPFDKTDDKQSVEIGETVNYTITGKVPDTTGFKTYKYQITDTMSTGLTFNNDVKVYVGGTEITENFTLKTGADAGGKAFVLDIDVMELTAGAKIEVKYSATVNENAVAKIEKNHATLDYSNDPNDSSKTTPREDEETVYSAKLVIDKYETDNKDAKLAGAKFVLYKEVTESGTTTKLYYKYTEATAAEKAKVEWVDDKAQATEVTTGSDGAANFVGLKDGTYYLEETEAPAGYNRLKDPVTVKINGENATEANPSALTHTEGVANNTGTELPSTGGMGTTVFYVIGSILVLAAVVLLVTKKRMTR